jgi:hypothetical protein
VTLTVSRLRAWSPEALPAAGRDLLSTADLLADLHGGVTRAAAAMVWQSPAGEAAREAAGDIGRALRALQESFSLQGEAVVRAAAALDRAQELLADASRLAAQHGLTMMEDGDVLPPPPVMMSADASEAELRRVADRRDAAQEARTRAEAMARAALAAAAEADRDCAAALRAGDSLGSLLAGLLPGGSGLLSATAPLEALLLAQRERLLDAVDGREIPESDADPAQINAWWLSLPSDVRAGLLAASPELLGNLDGLPAQVRDAANRARLGRERALLEAEVARLEQRLEDNWFGGTFTDDDAALGYARDKLRALDAIERALRPPATDRYLLLLDPSGDQLKAAVAIGDVDTADHVGVFTPGFTTTVQDSLGGYDRQLAALQAQATELAVRGGTGTVATVSWLGYEAPQWSSVWRPTRSVVSDEAASRGAVRLERFYDGLDAARDVPAHLTALGHSYGSLTTGLALQRGTGVDDAVFFGSPGIGTNDIDDLGLRAGRTYVVEARQDAIADLAAFGIDPNQLHGITGLSAAREIIDGVERAESVGHSAYLTDDTTSQYGIAAVVAGVGGRAPRDDGRGIGDVLATPVPWAQ